MRSFWVTAASVPQHGDESLLVRARAGFNSSGVLLQGEIEMADLEIVTLQLFGEAYLVASIRMMAQNHSRASLGRSQAALRAVKAQNLVSGPKSPCCALKELKAPRRPSPAPCWCGRKKPKGGQELLPQEMISDLACCSASALRVDGIQPAMKGVQVRRRASESLSRSP